MSRKKPKPDWQPRPYYAWNSVEAKAIKVLHQIVGREQAFFAIWRRKEDGAVSFSREMTDQLRAFAQAGDRESWVTLSFANATSWEETLRKFFDDGVMRQYMREGSRAPWPWPPSLEGKIYPDANGVPPPNEDDLNALAGERS